MAQNVASKDERPLKSFWLKNFNAVNTTDSRISLPDVGCFHDLLNAQPIGAANIHSVGGISAMLHDYGAHTIYTDFNVNIQGTEWLIGAAKDGTLWAYDVPDQKCWQIGSGLSGTDALDIAQFNDTMALIVDANGYWKWTPPAVDDTWPPPGQPLPSGSMITAVPSTNGAPQKGSAIAVYENRAWVAQKRLLNWSAPGDPTDFSSPSGGGSVGFIDPTLRSDIKCLFAANTYLYIFGESSVDVIYNLTIPTPSPIYNSSGQVTGYTDPTPTFTKENISSVVGTDQLESIICYGRLVLFANREGVWSLVGDSIQPISSAKPPPQANTTTDVYLSSIDGTYQYASFDTIINGVQWVNNAGQGVFWINNNGNNVWWNFSNTTFIQHVSAGQVNTNRLLNAAFLIYRKDDPIFDSGPLILMYQADMAGSKWWFADFGEMGQVGALTHICTAFVDNEPALFGYINNKLYQLFADPTDPPSARLMTGLWDFGDPITDKQAIRGGVRMSARTVPGGQAATLYIDTLHESYPLNIADIGITDWINTNEQSVQWTNNAGQVVYWLQQKPFFLFWGQAPPCFSKYLGFTLTFKRGTVFEVNSFMLDYKLAARWVGD